MKRGMMGKAASGGGGGGRFLAAGARTLNIPEGVSDHWSPARKACLALLNQPCTEMVIGVLAMCSFVLAFMETDYTDSDVPTWMTVANIATLAIYTLEAAMKIYVMRLGFFLCFFNVIDFTVIVLDITSLVLELSLSVATIPSMSFLRIFRLLRLARGFKVIVGFPQLALMVKSFYCAISATVYGSCLLFIILTVWSVCAVHFIHPVNKRVSLSGAYADCPRCEHAFSSVRNSMLTFIQQIIAGDSWGLVTIPIIEESPWTSMFFCVVFVSINFVILNVIMSVIVDSALKASQEDLQDIVRHKVAEFNAVEKRLKMMCHEMDQNGSGDLTEEEIMDGFDNIADFKTELQAMDVQKEDIHMVFSILDSDASGTVSYDEFISELFKMKSRDPHTLLMFIQHHVAQIREAMRVEAQARKGRQVSARGSPKGSEHSVAGCQGCNGSAFNDNGLVKDLGGDQLLLVKDVGGDQPFIPLLQDKDLSLQMSSQAQSLKELGEELRTLRRVISEDLARSLKDLSCKSESRGLPFPAFVDNLSMLPGGDSTIAQGKQYEVGQPRSLAAGGNQAGHRGPLPRGPQQQQLAASLPQRPPASAWAVRSCCAVQKGEQDGEILGRGGGPAAGWERGERAEA